MMKGSHLASHQLYLGRAFFSALHFGDLTSFAIVPGPCLYKFGQIFGGKLKIPKMISMSSNALQGPKHIILNVPGCFLITSDDACDV